MFWEPTLRSHLVRSATGDRHSVQNVHAQHTVYGDNWIREIYLSNLDHRLEGGKLLLLKPETQRESATMYPAFAWHRKDWHFLVPLPLAHSGSVRKPTDWDVVSFTDPAEMWVIE